MGAVCFDRIDRNVQLQSMEHSGLEVDEVRGCEGEQATALGLTRSREQSKAFHNRGLGVRLNLLKVGGWAVLHVVRRM